MRSGAVLYCVKQWGSAMYACWEAKFLCSSFCFLRFLIFYVVLYSAVAFSRFGPQPGAISKYELHAALTQLGMSEAQAGT